MYVETYRDSGTLLEATKRVSSIAIALVASSRLEEIHAARRAVARAGGFLTRF